MKRAFLKTAVCHGVVCAFLASFASAFWVSGTARAEEGAVSVQETVDAGAGLAGLPEAPERILLWGDTHLHTSYSVDAFLNQNFSADPDTAYRFAKGLPVVHPFNKTRVQIGTPLDFLVVADHAEFLGVMQEVYYRGVPREKLGLVDRMYAWLTDRQIRKAIDEQRGVELFMSFLPKPGDPRDAVGVSGDNTIPSVPVMVSSNWRRTTDIAGQHNEPGKFTTLIGWEWSSLPGGANLHRVVFTDADAATAQTFIPYGSDVSVKPEDLWAWLEKTSQETGADFVSIPHNSNISKGYMFSETLFDGSPMTAAYAKTRMRWEPVAEITQIKGDSETHPALSANDEFADFETYRFYIQRGKQAYTPRPGDYLRSAFKRGLEMEARIGVNPYKLGVIGSTDSHSGLATAEEDNFWGKMATDSIPENKKRIAGGDRSIRTGPSGWNMSASGLAAVWAQKNDRSSIMEAFRRREVYATTGPRIQVRMFGGWNFEPEDANARDIAGTGYAGGVPMGGDLSKAPEGKAPVFLVHAVKDPKGANLDRIQIVKGWLDGDGKTQEKVYDAVWAGDRQPDADGKLPPVGNTVNLDKGTYANTIGATELAVVWIDPDFSSGERAFYYTRVLQIPTPRHSLLDRLALKLDEVPDGPASIIRERAYTSPVWYTP